VISLFIRCSKGRLNWTEKCLLGWLAAGGILCLLLMAFALWFWGAKAVRGNLDEVFFLTLAGAFWLMVAHALFPWFGLSIRDDAWERKNVAALVALICALFSIAIIFAAGNLGEGPSYSENIFCAGLATGGLFGLWLGLELGGQMSVSIAEERDLASGVRFGGLLLAWGLILGRAVTGNWHSYAATIQHFLRDGWLAVMLCLLALVIERWLKPSRTRPFPSWPACGLAPALLYLMGAILWLWHLGRWEGMP
jgi:hypothetical protein